MPKRKRKAVGVVEALRQKAGPRSGLVKVAVYLEPEQLAALQELARSRARERGALRPDTSEAARHVLAGWLARQR